MSSLVLIVGLAVALAAAMAGAWLIAVRTGKSGWIDVVWSFAIGVAGVAAALLPTPDFESWQPRQWLVAALVGAWSLRLGVHIARRTLRGGDDPRYARFREEWGDSFHTRLFWFLQIQAAVALLLAVTVFIAARNPRPGFDLGDLLGVLVLVVAVLGEAVADRQLARFSADRANKGGICNVGLWNYSRHPNYFFEWLSWVAYPLIAIDLGGGYGWGWLALVGPAFMYYLLVHISGIPPLEQHMLRSRGDAFRRYQTRVNAFWPAPPKDAATAAPNDPP